jgi:hypothetical protein
MLGILRALGIFACDLLKSRRRLQAGNLFLRYQLNIALRRHRLGFDCMVATGPCWSG